MTTSRTAKFLADAIDASKYTQKEIAKYAGFPHPNVISMMKKGQTKVPLDRIPALARILNVDKFIFFDMALHEYQPELWHTLVVVLGYPLTSVEMEVLDLFRYVDSDGDMELDDPLRAAIVATYELGKHRLKTKGGKRKKAEKREEEPEQDE